MSKDERKSVFDLDEITTVKHDDASRDFKSLINFAVERTGRPGVLIHPAVYRDPVLMELLAQMLHDTADFLKGNITEVFPEYEQGKDLIERAKEGASIVKFAKAPVGEAFGASETVGAGTPDLDECGD